MWSPWTTTPENLSRHLDSGLTQIHRTVVWQDNVYSTVEPASTERPFRMNFGSALRHFREERTLSLRELATLSGVDHAYIHRLESGDKNAPSSEILDKLSRGLKLTTHKRRILELLVTTGEMDPQLFELALELPDRYDLVKVAATMSFRGTRPESKSAWAEKLEQIQDLLGHAGR